MQDNAKEYDIEALTGHESEYIEMVNEGFFVQLYSTKHSYTNRKFGHKSYTE